MQNQLKSQALLITPAQAQTGKGTVPSRQTPGRTGGGGSGSNLGTAIGIGVLGTIIYNEYRKKQQSAPKNAPSQPQYPAKTPQRNSSVRLARCGPRVPVTRLPNIAAIQRGLNTLGFGPYAVDGDLGPRTCAGIAAYLGVPAYGAKDLGWDALAARLDRDAGARRAELARPPQVVLVANPWGRPGNLSWGDFTAPAVDPTVGATPTVQLASVDIPDRSLPRFLTPPVPFASINANRTGVSRKTSLAWIVAVAFAALLVVKLIPKKPPAAAPARIRHRVRRDEAPHLDCHVPHSVSVIVAFRPDRHPKITMLKPLDGMAAQ